MSVSIVLADDHAVVRKGVRALLDSEPDFNVLAEATNGTEALDIVRELHPDVLLLDLVMPGCKPLDVTAEAHQRSPETRIVVLSMHRNQAYVQAALKGGAAGYVLKQSPSTEIVEAIRAAVQGNLYLSPPLSEQAIQGYVLQLRTEQLDPFETLTGREREVLTLTAEGLNNRDIATRLNIRPRTVETHRANLMSKLGLHSQADLFRYALQRGLVPVEE